MLRAAPPDELGVPDDDGVVVAAAAFPSVDVMTITVVRGAPVESEPVGVTTEVRTIVVGGTDDEREVVVVEVGDKLLVGAAADVGVAVEGMVEGAEEVAAAEVDGAEVVEVMSTGDEVDAMDEEVVSGALVAGAEELSVLGTAEESDMAVARAARWPGCAVCGGVRCGAPGKAERSHSQTGRKGKGKGSGKGQAKNA